MRIIFQRLPLKGKIRREDYPIGFKFVFNGVGEADRHGRLALFDELNAARINIQRNDLVVHSNSTAIFIAT